MVLKTFSANMQLHNLQTELDNHFIFDYTAKKAWRSPGDAASFCIQKIYVQFTNDDYTKAA